MCMHVQMLSKGLFLLQWLKEEFLNYLDCWEAVHEREGVTSAEKNMMMLSRETKNGLRITGTCTCVHAKYIYMYMSTHAIYIYMYEYHVYNILYVYLYYAYSTRMHLYIAVRILLMHVATSTCVIV